MEIKRNSKKHFDSTANYYDNSFDGKFVKPMYKCMLGEISKITTGNLLDVGCGNGNILSSLVDSDLKLYGIDLSTEMIKQAEKRLADRAKLCVTDAEKLPFDSDSFDVLVCNASFHHYPHPKTVLKEMRRVMKKDALLFIGEGYAIQPVRFFLNLSFHFSKSGDFHSYGKKELSLLLRQSGFALCEIKKTGSQFVLFIAKAQ